MIGVQDTIIPVISLSSYNPLGYETSSTDPNGNATHKKYNSLGRVIEIIHPDGTKEYSSYNKKGLPIRYIDQEGISTIYSYDSQDRILSKHCVATDGTLFERQIFTYNRLHLLSTTDNTGKTTNYSYDGAGRKISEECCGKVIRYTYDPLGRLFETSSSDGSQDLVIRSEHDILCRVISKTKNDGFGNLLYKISYEYDNDNNKTAIIRYIDGKPVKESFKYDSFNRLIEHIDGSDNITKIIYDESSFNKIGQRILRISTLDPDRVITIETKDCANNVARKEIFSNGFTISAVDYFYDGCSNLIEQQDHDYKNGQLIKSQTVQYQHNNTHKMHTVTRAAGTAEARTTSYAYTPAGKLATKTLPNQTVLNYTYNSERLLKRLSTTDGRLSHAFEYNKNGALLKATDELQNVVIERELDSFDNILKEKLSTGLEIEKSYDYFGRIISINVPKVGLINYVYSPLHLKTITRLNNGKILYQHRYTSYDLNGYLSKEELPNSLGTIEHFHTPTGQIKNILSPYFSEQYNYDFCRRLTEKKIDDITWNYTYDPLSQITKEDNGTIAQLYKYEYDALYNRIQKNDEAALHNELNEILTQGEISCKHDLNGNLIEKEGSNGLFRFSYDPLNRLIDATTPTCKLHFVYDPLGRRLSKIVEKQSKDGFWIKTIEENYLYDGMEEIGAFDTNGKIQQFRVLGNPVVTGMSSTIAIELDGKSFATCKDPQGNIRQLIDMSTKKIAASYEFTSFGETLVAQGPQAKLNPWSYANKRFDDELGLIYFGHRYYDSELARWLSPDPENFLDSMNLYQYLLNNPHRYVDPDGRFVIAIPLLIWGGTAGSTLFAGFTAYTALELSVLALGTYAAIKTGAYLGAMVFHQNAVVNSDSIQNADADAKNEKKPKAIEEDDDGEIFYDSTDESSSKLPDFDYSSGSRKKLQPHPDATGEHTSFKRHSITKNTSYESYGPQTNPKNPNRWQVTKRYDARNDKNAKRGGHKNKVTGERIPEPHVHDPLTPGGIRYPEPWEIPPSFF